MWIVRLALRRPYTFVVASLVLLLLAPFVLMRTPTDIFPSINIPVVSIVWQYQGLSAQEMEQRIVYVYERSLTATVADIEHIESNSYYGVGVVKVYFQPNASVDAGVSQLTAIAQTVLRLMPPGQQPPLVIKYSASTVPILQYAFSSPTMGEQEVYDLCQQAVRVGMSTVRGASLPWPYGGKTRVVSVDLDLAALKANNLTPSDVVNTINAQNLILPSGTAKIGPTEYNIELNASPKVLDELNELPIKTVNGAVIRVRHVAHVHDGSLPQQNVVRQDGVRGVLVTVLRGGKESTLEVVNGVKAQLPKVMSGLPPDLHVKEFADQSIFVRAAISGVLKEGVIAAALTAIMILLFIGSWRSTIIIALSIPLSVLTSILVLSALGETINLMTLGGLALAVGILVDDATVEIENVHRQMATGRPLISAILTGAQEIALPALVSTLCICIVFVPMFFLTGVARYLFVPLAEAVVFAMLASYVLSRTIIPTLVMWFYRNSPYHGHEDCCEDARKKAFWLFRPLMKAQDLFETGFERVRLGYQALLDAALHHRKIFASGFLACCAASLLLVPQLGQDFFPTVDSGQFRLHLRARSGTRIEETARLVDRIEGTIRDEIPEKEVAGILDNIGLPNSGISTSYQNNGTFGSGDADVLVSLKEDHAPTDDYIRKLRLRLNRDYPGTIFYFLPADIVSQTLNFGLPAPFNVQITGRNLDVNRAVAAKLADKIRHIPGAVDVRVQQPADLPKIQIAVDRTKANEIGLTEQDVANAMLYSLSGNGMVAPAYWLSPAYGISYTVNVRVPERAIASLASLQTIPVSGSRGEESGQILANLVTLTRAQGPPVVSHYNVQPVIDIFGGVSGRDLGSVLKEIQPLVKETEDELLESSRGSYITLRGQAETMHSSFIGLGIGLCMAIVLIYLLLVVNFHSWLDPFIIIMALPGALAGVAWGLYLTQTTLSVPALMGAIMSLGVATANSVLVVSFARDAMENGGLSSVTAALKAGATRLRAVVMTALAMIIGMLPMSLGLGEGGEQNAPLGRAVIGGLSFATVATLFFVPVMFALLRRRYYHDETPPELREPGIRLPANASA